MGKELSDRRKKLVLVSKSCSSLIKKGCSARKSCFWDAERDRCVTKESQEKREKEVLKEAITEVEKQKLAIKKAEEAEANAKAKRKGAEKKKLNAMEAVEQAKDDEDKKAIRRAEEKVEKLNRVIKAAKEVESQAKANLKYCEKKLEEAKKEVRKLVKEIIKKQTDDAMATILAKIKNKQKKQALEAKKKNSSNQG